MKRLRHAQAVLFVCATRLFAEPKKQTLWELVCAVFFIKPADKMKLKIYPRDNSPPKTENNYYKQLKPKHKMKKLFKTLFIATLLFTMTANAQITEGNWMVGGNASFANSSAKTEDGFTQSSTGIRIAPNIGYFITDKFALGLKTSLGYSKSDGGSGIGYGGGPFARYYFLNPERIVNLFAEADYRFGTTKSQGTDSTSSSSYSFKAGPAIFFNSSAALELALYYNSSTLDKTVFNDYGLSIGFQIHLENNK